MLKLTFALLALTLNTCIAQQIPFPDERMESLFAGMRKIEDGLGPHAFVASVNLFEDFRNEVVDHDFVFAGAVNKRGQSLIGFATTKALPYWKIKLSENGKSHFLCGSRHQLVPLTQSQEKSISMLSLDPINQTMASISSLLLPRSPSKGWHRRRSGESLDGFDEKRYFDLLYAEPGTGIAKKKLTRYRFDRKPTPHVIQWDLQHVLKSGTINHSANTVTKWKQLQGHYVPEIIDGITSTPGNGPKCFGTIEIQWSFQVPDFDPEASDWIDTLATAFPVDSFLGE